MCFCYCSFIGGTTMGKTLRFCLFDLFRALYTKLYKLSWFSRNLYKFKEYSNIHIHFILISIRVFTKIYLKTDSTHLFFPSNSYLSIFFFLLLRFFPISLPLRKSYRLTALCKPNAVFSKVLLMTITNTIYDLSSLYRLSSRFL